MRNRNRLCGRNRKKQAIPIPVQLNLTLCRRKKLNILLLCTILLCSTLLHAFSRFYEVTEHFQLQIYWEPSLVNQSGRVVGAWGIISIRFRKHCNIQFQEKNYLNPGKMGRNRKESESDRRPGIGKNQPIPHPWAESTFITRYSKKYLNSDLPDTTEVILTSSHSLLNKHFIKLDVY